MKDCTVGVHHYTSHVTQERLYTSYQLFSPQKVEYVCVYFLHSLVMGIVEKDCFYVHNIVYFGNVLKFLFEFSQRKIPKIKRVRKVNQGLSLTRFSGFENRVFPGGSVSLCISV